MAYLTVATLPVKAGHCVDGAMANFEDVKPVHEKHGFTRVGQPMGIVKTLRISAPANLIMVFQSEDAKTSMKGMGADPEFQSLIALRDQNYDLDNATTHLVERLQRTGNTHRKGR